MAQVLWITSTNLVKIQHLRYILWREFSGDLSVYLAENLQKCEGVLLDYMLL